MTLPAAALLLVVATVAVFLGMLPIVWLFGAFGLLLIVTVLLIVIVVVVLVVLTVSTLVLIGFFCGGGRLLLSGGYVRLLVSTLGATLIRVLAAVVAKRCCLQFCPG